MSGQGDRDREDGFPPPDADEQTDDQVDPGSPGEEEETEEAASTEASEVEKVRAEFEAREADIRAMLREERRNRRNNQDNVVKLQRQLDDAQRRMESFEARQRDTEVARQDADLATREAVADRKYRAALEAGDTDAIVLAQRELTDARTERILASRLSKEKSKDDGDAREPARQADPPPQEEQRQLSALAQRWVQSHSWYGQQGDVDAMIDTRIAITAFQMLGEKGLTQDDPEMFTYVDQILKDRLPHRYGGGQARGAAAPSRASSAGAGRAPVAGAGARDELPEMTLKAARLGGMNTNDPKVRAKLARAFAEVKEFCGSDPLMAGSVADEVRAQRGHGMFANLNETPAMAPNRRMAQRLDPITARQMREALDRLGRAQSNPFYTRDQTWGLPTPVDTEDFHFGWKRITIRGRSDTDNVQKLWNGKLRWEPVRINDLETDDQTRLSPYEISQGDWAEYIGIEDLMLMRCSKRDAELYVESEQTDADHGIMNTKEMYMEAAYAAGRPPSFEVDQGYDYVAHLQGQA